MGLKYCPYCKEIVIAKAQLDYSQTVINGIPAKKRRIAHLIEDGGCGREWYTAEIVISMEYPFKDDLI